MRFCFDRLCFATKRPAQNSNSNAPHSSTTVDAPPRPADVDVATVPVATPAPPPQQPVSNLFYADYQKLQPAIIDRDWERDRDTDTDTRSEAKPPDIVEHIEPVEEQRQIHTQIQSPAEIQIQIPPTPPAPSIQIQIQQRYRRHSSAEDRNLNTRRNDSNITEALRKAASMQQEPNANYQFPTDLGLVSIVNNNNNTNTHPSGSNSGSNNNSNINNNLVGGIVTLPAAGGLIGLEHTASGLRLIPAPPTHSDVLTHTLIYGTPPSGAQQLNQDPRSLLHQQELQLQQRYQQLQQLQAQTQGLYTSQGSPVLYHQPSPGSSQPVAIPGATCHSPTQLQPPNTLNLQQQMQSLRISGCTPSGTGGSATPSPVGLVDPNFIVSNYVAASPQEERFIQIIQAKELKIQEMQRALQFKDNEIAELKSHLDKFQSVFPFSRGSAAGCAGTGGASGSGAGGSGGSGPGTATGATRKSGQNFQRQRALGISAEPQSESSLLLEHVSFPKYDKDERWVLWLI